MTQSDCKIISFDGGGIRGLFTVRLLQKLVELRPGLLDEADFYAGTSTGAIIAAGLADGKTPAELVQLYLKQGPVIFDRPFIPRFFRAKYDEKGRLNALTGAFGGRLMEELKKPVLIPAFDLDNKTPPVSGVPSDPERWKPKFFHNIPGKKKNGTNDSDGAEKVVDVLMASSAAPSFFPSYNGFIDGGVSANNPSMAAVAQALDPRAHQPLAKNLGDIHLLSLGTGTSPHYIRSLVNDWGALRWAGQLISLMLDGNVDIPNYQCGQLLGSRYQRLSCDFPDGTEIDLDDVDKMQDLIALADQVAQGTNFAAIVAWLDNGWK